MMTAEEMRAAGVDALDASTNSDNVEKSVGLAIIGGIHVSTAEVCERLDILIALSGGAMEPEQPDTPIDRLKRGERPIPGDGGR